MDRIKLDKTKIAIKQVVDNIKRITVGTGLALQVIFIAYHIYSLCTSLHEVLFIVVNAALLSIGVIMLFVSLAALHNKDLTGIKKKISRLFRHAKLTLHIITLLFAVYEILCYPHSDLKVILTALAAIGFAMQVLLEIAASLVCRYLHLVWEGMQMDLEEIGKNPVVAVGSSAIKGVGKTISGVKNMVLHPIQSSVTVANAALSAANTLTGKTVQEKPSSEAIAPKTNKAKEKRRQFLMEKSEANKAAEKEEQRNKLQSSKEKLAENWRTLWHGKRKKNSPEDPAQTETAATQLPPPEEEDHS